METEEEEVGTDMGYTRIHIQYKYDGRGEGGREGGREGKTTRTTTRIILPWEKAAPPDR